jgi:hypothetical protein
VNASEVHAVVRRFEECSLSRDEWNHHAQLAVAMWYLTHHTEVMATELMIRGIRRFNHVRGIHRSRRGGYHETMTLFWLGMGRKLMGFLPELPPLEMVNRFLEMPKDLPLRCYSESVLWSSEARYYWVEPDVRSIDNVAEELFASQGPALRRPQSSPSGRGGRRSGDPLSADRTGTSG